MEKDIYTKQKKLYNPEENNPQIYIYGCGSIGSHVILGLTKIGIQNITAYDYDKVEETNIPAQIYDTESAEHTELKTEAIKRITKNFTGINITTHNQKIDENFNPETPLNSIHILAFDNIEARKIIANKLKGYQTHIIDGRIGGFQYEKYHTQTNDKNYIKYLKTLEGKFSEQECGEKTLWTVNTQLATKIITDVIKITKNIKPDYKIIGNILNEKTIIEKGERKWK